MGIAKFFLIPSSVAIIIPSSLISLNTNFNNAIVLATYQSYIDPEIADEAYDEFGLKTIYFENDKEAFNGFASGAYDLAILSSSTLEEAIEKKLVKPIDWARFNNSFKKHSILKNGFKFSGEEGNLMKELSSLYSPVANKFFEKNPKLAEYGVPYFLSYLSFAYRGPKLNFEASSSQQGPNTNPSTQVKSDGNSLEKPVSWNKLMKTIASEPRFRTNDDRPKLGMVEDELTLFSLSKLSSQSESEGQSGNNTSTTEQLFADREDKQTEREFHESFLKINGTGIDKKKMGSRPLFFSPDSVVLSKALSDGTLAGIFFYNGDALYGHYLLEEEKAKTEKVKSGDNKADGETGSVNDNGDDNIGIKSSSGQTKMNQDLASEGQKVSGDKDDEIHIVPVTPALWFMDSIAISTKVSGKREDEIYKFLAKLSFDDLKNLDKLERETALEDEDEDSDSDEVDTQKVETDDKSDKEINSDSDSISTQESQKLGWLIRNFKQVQYTPALKEFNQWIKGKHESQQKGKNPPLPTTQDSDDEEPFYKKEIDFLYGNPDIEECLEKKNSKNSLKDSNNQCFIVFERGLSDKQNLHLTLAFEKWKSLY